MADGYDAQPTAVGLQNSRIGRQSQPTGLKPSQHRTNASLRAQLLFQL
jgi:hypothetical protein